MKKAAAKALEVRYEDLDQYDGWNDEILERWDGQYAHHIGKFMIVFSALEHSLDVGLATLINDRSHDEGYVIIKDLDVQAKIDLFYDLAYPRVQWMQKKRSRRMTELATIKKQLQELSELRNKVAHARWMTMDKDGYVRVDARTHKENGFVTFRKVKITASILHNASRRMLTLAEKVSEFPDNIWE
ncbi:MAG: hypothetical protein AAB582_01190 [Patescibacteria group bacterium]